jgi:hypothetical protein
MAERMRRADRAGQAAKNCGFGKARPKVWREAGFRLIGLGAAQKWQSCGLLSALRQSVQQAEPAKPCRKPKKATGQKEMQLPIEGKMSKESSAKTTAAKPEHKSA